MLDIRQITMYFLVEEFPSENKDAINLYAYHYMDASISLLIPSKFR